MKKSFFPFLIIVLSATGLLFSYILAEEFHFINLPQIEGSSPGFFSQINAQVCGDEGKYVSCASVAKSIYARVLGLPVAIWGMGFYLITLLTIISFWLSSQFIRPAIGVFLFWITGIGIFIDVTLLIVSTQIIKAICPLCLFTYAITFLLFITTLVYLLKNRINPIRIISLFKNIHPPHKKKKISLYFIIIGVILMTSMGISYAVNESLLFSKKEFITENKDKEIAAIVSKFSKQKKEKEDIESIALYVSGASDAPVTIIEFSDFFCPYCRYLPSMLEQLVNDNPGKIKIMFINYPLDSDCNPYVASEKHPGACELAIGSICAEQQGLMDQYQKAAFENQNKELSGEMLRKILKQSGVSQADFLKCLSSATSKKILSQHIGLSKRLGISLTPTLYINQKKYQGRIHIEALQKIIDIEVTEQS